MYAKPGRAENTFKCNADHITLACLSLTPTASTRGPFTTRLGPPDSCSEDIDALVDSLLFMPGACACIINQDGSVEPLFPLKVLKEPVP